MRGDYLRDLYAKTLAVVGLGVLAAGGALLDYLPVGVVVPTPSHPARPTATASTPVRLPDAATLTAAAPRRRSALTTNHADDRFSFQLTPFQATTAAGPVGTSVSLVAHPRGPISDDSTAASSSEPAMLMPAVVETEFTRTAQSIDHGPAEAFVAPVDDPGVVTLAFRKTGSSLAKTGAKAGSSIVGAGSSIAGAVRGIGGVVRKALPAI